MADPRVNLRNPWLAGVLAYLVPGAGHLYQRRYVKAAIYFVCIVGIYTWGCSLGEAKAVHLRWDAPEPGHSPQRTLGFVAQAGVGTVAIPALLQFSRARNQDRAESANNQPPGQLLEEIDTTFSGRLHHNELGHRSVSGKLTGQVTVGQYGYGVEFSGQLVVPTADGGNLTLAVLGSRNAGSLDLGPRVTGLDNVTVSELNDGHVKAAFSGSERRFSARIVDSGAGIEDHGVIEGTIPRSLLNHAFAPLTDEAMQHLHRRLGKFYEMALVYTWIAGLLNVLAVWDALQGPAYGYGDEPPEEQSPKSEKPDQSAKAVEAAVPATAKG